MYFQGRTFNFASACCWSTSPDRQLESALWPNLFYRISVHNSSEKGDIPPRCGKRTL